MGYEMEKSIPLWDCLQITQCLQHGCARMRWDTVPISGRMMQYMYFEWIRFQQFDECSFCESVCTMYSMPQYSWCTHTSRPGTSKQVKQKNTIDGRKEIIRNNHNHHQHCWRALLYTREKGGNNFLLSIRSWTNRKKIVSTLMI